MPTYHFTKTVTSGGKTVTYTNTSDSPNDFGNFGDFKGGHIRSYPSSGGRGDQPKSSRAPTRNVAGRPSLQAKKNPFAGQGQQDYEKIRAECLKGGFLFEDPEFPATDDNIFFSRRPPRPFEWSRPSEICSNPQFFVGGASRFDVQQGELGDCWLLAAVASLTCNQKLLYRVCPQSQSFTDGYAGIFIFMFWHQGVWTEVVVDDRLPTYNGRLVFMHSTENNEFWSALLEKAYAKVHGSYEALKGGSTSEAMEDFTGGVTEMIDIRNPPKNLFKIMLKAYERNSLMGCSIDADPGKIEAELANGLVMGHAYSITAVKLVNVQARSLGQIGLIRIRNPWGNECEWLGSWSDKSREWSLISDKEKQEIGLTFDNDGEFWMSFKDFTSNFQKLEICNLSPDSLDDEDMADKSKKKWEVTMEHGQWSPGQNAGGCRNFLKSFWTNPQYRVTVTDPDDDDEDDLCSVIIGLLQKDRRKKRQEGQDMLTIGYAIYKLKEDSPTTPLEVDFFKYNASFDKSPSFINMREMCGRHQFPPGTYCIVPSTFNPNEKGEFLLRVFTEKANLTHEMDEETGYTAEPEHAAPPISQEDDKALKQKFQRFASDDMEIDAKELKAVLDAAFKDEFHFAGFPLDICRSMVAMHDGDLSGKLGYDEFKTLWNDIKRWKANFKEFDADKSGALSSMELRSVFRKVGFKLSNGTLSSLLARYATPCKGDKQGEITFTDFIACAVRLKTMIDSFKNMDPTGRGAATFTMDQFVQTTMYS